MTAHKEYVLRRFAGLSIQLKEYAYDTAADGPEVPLLKRFFARRPEWLGKDRS